MFALLSYSSLAKDVALSIRNALVTRDIPVWMDRIDIRPGDNWQKSLEAAIHDCDSLILLLSPNSAASPEVEAEWGLAKELGKRIITVLVGDTPIPFRLRPYQYINLIEKGLIQVTDELARVLPKNPLPKHIPVGSVGTTEQQLGWIRIELPTLCDGYRAVLMDLGRFASFQSILDDLFTHYLGGAVAPFCYGSEWVLSQRISGYFVLPVQWVSQPFTPIRQLAPSWSAALPYELGLGLSHRMRWQVLCGKDQMSSAGAEKAIGVVTNNIELVRDLINSPKYSYRLEFEDRFRRRQLGEVKLDKYQYQCVLSPKFFDFPPGVIFEHTSKDSDE